MDETKRQLVALSGMPFSAVIVGIGEGITYPLAPRDPYEQERKANYIDYVNRTVPSQKSNHFSQFAGERENEDAFKDMKVLDADATILTDPEDNKAVRDVVQFVQYEDFEEIGIRELAQAVLGEVPDQFVDYMVMLESIGTKVGEKLYKGKRSISEIIAGA